MNENELRLYNQIEKGSSLVSTNQITIVVDEGERDHYLGMSGIGYHACELWFNYHRPDLVENEDSPKLRRIFRLGKILEEEIIQQIEIGNGVVTGRQTSLSDFQNRFRGHIDGRWEYDWILELKGVYAKSWAEFIDFQTPISRSFPGYYSQCQMYMHYTGLSKAMLVMYGKNTSEIIPREVIYNKIHVKFLLKKAEWILNVNHPCNIPEALRGSGNCKWCKYISKD